MTARRRVVLGFLFASVYAAVAVWLRPRIVEFGPPRILDVFLVGIGATSFFFSWIPALALFAGSILLAMDYFEFAGLADLVRLGFYTFGGLGLTWAFDHLKKALARSRQAEETKRLVLESASDGIFLCDEEGIILDVNAAGCEMLGCAHEQIAGKAAADFTSGRTSENPFETAEGRIADRRLIRKNGTEVLVEASSKHMADGRLIAIVRDVTERRRSEALTRSVVYSAVDGIVTVDESGAIVSFNPAAERLFGCAAEEAIGRKLAELIPDAALEGSSRETTARRRNGSVFPIDLAVGEMLLPEGRMFTATVRDITGRREAEEALRQAHETMRAIIETTPLAIFAIDLEGRVTSWNAGAERMFGYTESEVKGQFLPVVPDRERHEFLAAIENARQGRFMKGTERVRRRNDGSAIEVSVWNAALRNAAGEVTGILGVIADMSERRRLEEQLHQSQKMEAIGRLAGGMAHDFNNILTVISGYSRLMLESMPEELPYRADAEEVVKAAERAGELTNQLLTFSRRQKVHPRVVNLNAIVTGVDKMLRRLIGEDVRLVARLNSELGNVKADPGQIEQVILNLAVNARDAMERGGRLTIETANVELGEDGSEEHFGVPPGSYVMLAVSDTGRGMTAEERSRMFEPFYTTKPKGKGTGLGLSTVYGIIRQAKGEIWVYSEPGAGTTVKIYLPRTTEAPEAVEAQAPGLCVSRGTETVLLVEDEAPVRKLVADLLRHDGYRVLVADDPQHALRICARPSEKIHLLLTDVVMPEMNGREMADRALELRPGLRVLYMSGYTDTVITDYGIKGAFLAKPFTPAALSYKVRQVLDTEMR